MTVAIPGGKCGPPSDDGYDLVLVFLDQSDSFAHGFTCGRIWEQMIAKPFFVKGIAPAGAQPTIEAIAMRLGWIETIVDIGDGWLDVKLVNPTPAPKK